MLSLHSLLSGDGTNVVEIYFTKKVTDTFSIDINVSDKFVTKVMELFNNWKSIEYISFHRNDLVYVYEKANDNQFAYSKNKESDYIINKKHLDIYFISYKHSKIPTHLFPCTNDMDDRITYTISECRLSNRLSLIVKKDIYASSVFIEYRHSPQVEIDKIESSIRSVIDAISKIDISL